MTTKSCNGAFAELSATYTHLPLNSLSKSQEGTARSTREAELNSMDVAVHDSGLPLSLLREALLDHTMPMIVHEDNAAARIFVQKRYSRKLGYTAAKRGKRSIRALREVFVGDPDDLEAPPYHQLPAGDSADMKADILTKHLDHTKHWKNCRELVLIPINPQLLSTK